MSEARSNNVVNTISRKQRARAESVVGQFLAIREKLKEAEAGGVEVDDVDEVAAQLTVAAFKHHRA